jgi:hypothetical protein
MIPLHHVLLLDIKGQPGAGSSRLCRVRGRVRSLLVLCMHIYSINFWFRQLHSRCTIKTVLVWYIILFQVR